MYFFRLNFLNCSINYSGYFTTPTVRPFRNTMFLYSLYNGFLKKLEYFNKHHFIYFLKTIYKILPMQLL